MVDKIGIPVYLYTDDEILVLEGKERGYNIIDRPYQQHYQEPSMDMMIYLHEKIKADYYLMLPLTSPNRDKVQLAKCMTDFLQGGFATATSLKKLDRKNYCLSGAFWFFHFSQVYNDDLIDDNTKYYIMDTLDIDTIEDVKNEY
jgi:CMP-N-acetylneuraminic acid synthetase